MDGCVMTLVMYVIQLLLRSSMSYRLYIHVVVPLFSTVAGAVHCSLQSYKASRAASIEQFNVTVAPQHESTKSGSGEISITVNDNKTSCTRTGL
jgi:hypothetical protein